MTSMMLKKQSFFFSSGYDDLVGTFLDKGLPTVISENEEDQYEREYKK